MILLENQTNETINLELLEKIATYLNVNKDLELLVVDNTTIQDLNKQFRNKDSATDVLSFPLEDIEGLPLGSIVISIDKAKDLSHTLGHSVQEELALLFTHGLLHLLGFDHEVDNGEMRKAENGIISHFNLPKSLIIRNEDI